MFVSTHMRKCVIAAALVCFVFNTSDAEAAPPEFLEQNWSNSTRQKFYTTSQGSQIMPYKWFKALERADSSDGFLADGLRREPASGSKASLSGARHRKDSNAQSDGASSGPVRF